MKGFVGIIKNLFWKITLHNIPNDNSLVSSCERAGREDREINELFEVQERISTDFNAIKM